jgi:hypothetical protein
VVDDYARAVTQRAEFNGTRARHWSRDVQMSGNYPERTAPAYDLPEEPIRDFGPVTVEIIKKVTGYTHDEQGQQIECIEEFEQTKEPKAEPENDLHFQRRVLLHQRLCQVAVQMHGIRQTEDILVYEIAFSAGEHRNAGIPEGDGRQLTPYRGGPGWNERVFHTLEQILSIKEENEHECYSEKGLRRCPAVLEWHPDKCLQFAAGPRAKKICKEWYKTVQLAIEVMSDKVLRERYWKHGIWTDKNLSEAETLVADLKHFNWYAYHPKPAQPEHELKAKWVMKDATDWLDDLQAMQELKLSKLISNAPVLDTACDL